MYELHVRLAALRWTAGMSSNDILTPKPGIQLLGIYHTDRMMGDPLRTVVDA